MTWTPLLAEHMLFELHLYVIQTRLRQPRHRMYTTHGHCYFYKIPKLWSLCELVCGWFIFADESETHLSMKPTTNKMGDLSKFYVYTCLRLRGVFVCACCVCLKFDALARVYTRTHLIKNLCICGQFVVFFIIPYYSVPPSDCGRAWPLLFKGIILCGWIRWPELWLSQLVAQMSNRYHNTIMMMRKCVQCMHIDIERV